MSAMMIVTIASLGGCVVQAWTTRQELKAQPPPGRLVDVGGYRLHLWCTGAGSTTVILDSGLGGTAFDWASVQPPVSRFARVCSYDRAGLGYSDSGPRPRTSERIAKELEAVLNAAHLRGPIVLVGASLGGWNVRYFASTHEDRAAGLVLVDARHEDQSRRQAALGVQETPAAIIWAARLAPLLAYSGIARALRFAPGLPPDFLPESTRQYARATQFRSSVLVASADELRNGDLSAAQVRATRHALNIPVVVMSAGQRAESGYAKLLNDLQQDQLLLSRRSCQIIASQSGHVIQLSQPELVVSAIRVTVDAWTRGTAPDCTAALRGN